MTDEQDLLQDFVQVDRPTAFEIESGVGPDDWRDLLERAGVTRVHLRNGTTCVGVAKRRGTSLTPWIVLQVPNAAGGSPSLIDEVYVDPGFIASVTIESVAVSDSPVDMRGRVRLSDDILQDPR